jgi:ATP-dependent exoDNAse (exonuclease V) beta subunit
MSRVEIISASAGTGKTTRLARLIHEAVAAKKARSEAILATTFTNRAAAELAERARETLLQVGETTAAHRLHAARVGTVNSVCGRIVQDFAFLHGLSPRVSVLDERRAAEEPLRAGSEALPRELLNELEHLYARMGPVGAHPGGIAAAGGWDWRQDITRIIDLARSNAIGVDHFPDFIERSTASLLGFLQPPAADGDALDTALDTALRQFLDDVDPAVDTTQKTRKACERARSALSRGVRDLPWSEWASLAQLEVAKKSEAHGDPVREAALAHDRHPRLHGDLRRAVKAVFEAAAYALEAYQSHKRGLGVIDFVDQETEALALLQDEAVREQLREEVDLVLVDEFQDTSPIQLAIFLELSRIAPRSVWVGDPKQAIYGFRGADPALMDAAVAALLGGAAPETLDRSYRSRPALVRLTSDLFAPAFAETGIAEELVRVDPANLDEPEGLGPILERWILEPGVNANSGRPQQNAELDLVSLASGVCALLADPESRVRDRATGEARAIEPGDIAVLCFRNAQCTGLARELEARGVRAVVGRPGLVATLEAQLALAALRLWVDPADSLARAQLARWLDEDDDGEAWLEAVLAARGSDELFSELEPVVALREAREPRAFSGVLASFASVQRSAGFLRQCPRCRRRPGAGGDLRRRDGAAREPGRLARARGELCRPLSQRRHTVLAARAVHPSRGAREPSPSWPI